MAQVRNNVTQEGGNAMVRSTKRHSNKENKDIDRPPDDRSEESEEIVETLMDDDEVSC